jgi:RND family efflux transporter MFP subunit
VATDAGAAAASAAPPALVRVQPVVEEATAARVLAVGTVRPRNTSIVASGSDGIVAEFMVEQGDFVKAGTVLSRLRMKSTDLALEVQRQTLAERQAEYEEIQTPRAELVEEAMARQEAAEAAKANAQRRLQEYRLLGQRGAANESTIKDAEDTLLEAHQNLLAARAIYQRISQGARPEEKLQAKARLEAQRKQVEFLEAEKEKRITLAPFDGFVVEEHTFDGQWLAKGDPVVTLAQLDEVDVQVQIDQAFIRQVRPNNEVSVRIPGTRQQHWVGRVRAIVPKTDWQQGSRSFPVIVAIQNEFTDVDGVSMPLLREGMMAEAEFSGEPVDAIMVPKDSLVRTSNGTFVYAVNPASGDQPPSVTRVLVETGISDQARIQVLTTELKAGMQVVTEGAERLRPFQAISILPDEDPAAVASQAPAGN